MADPHFNPVFANLPTTIFTVMSGLAVEHSAINLGQGFPDEDGPLEIRESAAAALREGPNQYPPTRGVPALRQAIAAHAKRFYGFEFHPDRNVLVTSGGTEALTASILALAGAGGEVVLIEPAYDSYRPIALAAGARVKSLKLSPPAWRLEERALAEIVTEETRVVMLNTPLNPIGRAFDRDELAGVARVLARSNAIAICDEVYEHLVFDGRAHLPLMSFPAMAERTVRVGSAGKMFSLTGWKVGWVTGAAPLIDVIAKAHQFITFTTAPALQRGVAYALENQMDFTLTLTRALAENRDLLATRLSRIGFDVLPCEGTYFLTAGIRKLTNERDDVFCSRLVKEAGVALIPLSAFFEAGEPGHLVRFAFCKKRHLLEEALDRLDRYFQTQHT
ncbi:MAG TPA: aminotransferase [Rhizomicrobium sp.]|jgi:aspartate/methionine/tyrosine aminotransferase|nr:aminotransferase [Rhizomicrobium sp.]